MTLQNAFIPMVERTFSWAVFVEKENNVRGFPVNAISKYKDARFNVSISVLPR